VEQAQDPRSHVRALHDATQHLLGRIQRFRWLEDISVWALTAAVSLYVQWPIVSNSLTFQVDSLAHQYWLRRFRDPELFHDPLTNSLVNSGNVPPGTEGLYWLASRLVDPVAFAEWLPLALAPLSAWLVFRIIREHAGWRPAAWIGVGLFTVLWDVHRFSGGQARGFVYPVVLLTVLLLLRRRDVAASFVPPIGFLLYPPAGITALAVLAITTIEWRGLRPRIDHHRALLSFASFVLVSAAAFVPELVANLQPDPISRAEAHRYPEFGPNGFLHFFARSTGVYLRQNRSGFDLRQSGSILALTAVLLIPVRPRNARLLRGEVWAMLVASLSLFVLAHALLFRLYLPHRYTYPLIPFFCILISVAANPTFKAVRTRRGGLALSMSLAVAVPLVIGFCALVLFAIPAGPGMSARGFVSWVLHGLFPYLLGGLLAGMLGALLAFRPGVKRLVAAGAAAATFIAGGILMGELAIAGLHQDQGVQCRDLGLLHYLGALPKDAVIAGDPAELDCVPTVSRRAVVMASKLYQPWHKSTFLSGRSRMLAEYGAYYGGSRQALVDLRRRYGADYLVVRPPLLRRNWNRGAPFKQLVRSLINSVPVPARERLPDACLTYKRGSDRVYDLACVEDRTDR
jgi:hypothetical protein